MDSLKRWQDVGTLAGGSKKDFDIAPLHTTLDKYERDEFRMEEIRGVFWPTTVYERHFKKIAAPADLQTIRGQQGVVLPEQCGVALPLGVFRLLNVHSDALEKRDRIEDSRAASSSLVDGQIAEAHASMARGVRSSIDATMAWGSDGPQAADKKLESEEPAKKQKKSQEG